MQTGFQVSWQCGFSLWRPRESWFPGGWGTLWQPPYDCRYATELSLERFWYNMFQQRACTFNLRSSWTYKCLYAYSNLAISCTISFTGTRDSSGLRFFYTRTPREHDAAVLHTGHDVNPYMIIPPNTANYTVTGMCIADCTNKVLMMSL